MHDELLNFDNKMANACGYNKSQPMLVLA